MIDTDKYEDYTMWIKTEHAGWFFNGEWEDGESEEQVIKEWNERLEEARADDVVKCLSAELRKHTDYYEDEDGITSMQTDVIFSWEAGEEE
tara:strand:+ start:244 stop:516 length:273 start_codon:yes stop_codon:yes gene_type:complete